ncbi:hypothetical protein HGRIS_010397 [Hohenbuehelia grisea]|uniref:Uncharacterized protein n=1 Tax=Hohenbuehelia grisea TaxID=104357 RepID=A0ABR3J487_9AGAR
MLPQSRPSHDAHPKLTLAHPGKESLRKCPFIAMAQHSPTPLTSSVEALDATVRDFPENVSMCRSTVLHLNILSVGMTGQSLYSKLLVYVALGWSVASDGITTISTNSIYGCGGFSEPIKLPRTSPLPSHLGTSGDHSSYLIALVTESSDLPGGTTLKLLLSSPRVGKSMLVPKAAAHNAGEAQFLATPDL